MNGHPIGALILTRIHLRRAQATADAPTKAAIDVALQPDNHAALTEAMIEQSGGANEHLSGGGVLAALLQFFIANLPQILALVLAMFGGGVPKQAEPPK